MSATFDVINFYIMMNKKLNKIKKNMIDFQVYGAGVERHGTVQLFLAA